NIPAALARARWLWPFCAGLAVGICLVVFFGFPRLDREPELSAPVTPLTSEPRPSSSMAGKPTAASLTTFEWRDEAGVLRRTKVETARYNEFVAAQLRQLDQDQQALATARSNRLRAALAPIFADI